MNITPDMWKWIENEPWIKLGLAIITAIIICLAVYLWFKIFVWDTFKPGIVKESLIVTDTIKTDTVKVKAPNTKNKMEPKEDNRKGNFSDGQTGGSVTQIYNEAPKLWSLTDIDKSKILKSVSGYKYIFIFLNSKSPDSKHFANELRDSLINNNYQATILSSVAVVGSTADGYEVNTSLEFTYLANPFKDIADPRYKLTREILIWDKPNDK